MIGTYIHRFIYAVGARWLLGEQSMDRLYAHPTTTTIVYGTISIIGAGKNNLGNAPTVILEKVSGNQVKNLTLLIGQVDITLLN